MILSQVAAWAATLLVSLSQARPVAPPRFTAAADCCGWTVANDDAFLVLWRRNNHTFAQKLEPDASPVEVPSPTIAGFGHRYIAIRFADGSFRSELLDGNLRPIASHDIGIVAQPLYTVGVVTTAGTALVYAFSGDDLYVRFLDADGAPFTGWINLGLRGSLPPTVAADPNGFEVVAGFAVPEGGMKILTRRLGVRGEIGDWVELSTRMHLSTFLAAFVGTRYVVVTNDPPEAVFFAPDGSTSTAPVSLPTDNFERLKSIARSTAVFERHSIDLTTGKVDDVDANSASSLHGEVLIVAMSGTIVTARILGTQATNTVSRGGVDQFAPKIASGETTSLVVWQENERVMAMRIGAEGEPLDSEPIAVSAPGAGSFTPAVAFGDGEYLVTWVEGQYSAGHVRGRRIGENGALQNIFAIDDGDSSTSPVVAFGNGMFLVAWVGYLPNSAFNQILATRVSRLGPLDVPALNVSRTVLRNQLPSITFGGGRFAVAWQRVDWPGGHTPLTTISAFTFVTTDGSLMPVITLTDTVANSSAGPATIAWNGEEFLVVWQTHGFTYAQHFDRNGNASGEPKIVDAGTRQVNAVAPAGDGWLLAFWYPQVSGIFLNADLTVASSFTLDAETGSPALAPNGPARAIVYRRIIAAPPYFGANTIMINMINEEPATPRRRRSS